MSCPGGPVDSPFIRLCAPAGATKLPHHAVLHSLGRAQPHREGSGPPNGGSETKCYQWLCGAPAPFNPRTRLAGDLGPYRVPGGTTPPIPIYLYMYSLLR